VSDLLQSQSEVSTSRGMTSLIQDDRDVVSRFLKPFSFSVAAPENICRANHISERSAIQLLDFRFRFPSASTSNPTTSLKPHYMSAQSLHYSP